MPLQSLDVSSAAVRPLADALCGPRLVDNVPRVASARVPYMGNPFQACSHACARDQVSFPYYSCSNDKSWAEGDRTFFDPLPPGAVILDANVTLFGRFECTKPTPGAAAVLVSMQDQLLSTFGVTSAGEDCGCPNCCFRYVPPAKDHPTGFSSYNYGGWNHLQVQVVGVGGISCLSAADVVFSYGILAPCVQDISPPFGPVNTSVDIRLIGEHFIPTVTFACLFGKQSVIATSVTAVEIVCPVPLSQDESTVPVSISSDGVTWTPTGHNYTYYPNPILTDLDPTSGPSSGGTDVRVHGTGFFATKTLKCMFGDLESPLPAFYESSTSVRCTSPVNSENLTSVLVRITQNGVSYTEDGIEFQYLDHVGPIDSTSGNPPRTVLWVSVGIVSIVFVLSLTAFGVIFIHSRKNRLRKELEAEKSGLLVNDSAISYGSSHISDKRLDDLLTGMDTIHMSEITDLEIFDKGSSGHIYRGNWRGTTVAVKQFLAATLTQELVAEMYREQSLMKNLRHPNVLQYLGTSVEESGMCIIMEYMPRGSLYRLIHNPQIQLDLKMIKRVCVDTACGMSYLHNMSPPIIHRDLKSHNLLVASDWRVKVADFGLSKVLEQAVATLTACGTPSWTAPEVIRHQNYDTLADVYSFGVVLWELFARQDPYPGIPPFQIVYRVGQQQLRPTLSTYLLASFAFFDDEDDDEDDDDDDDER